MKVDCFHISDDRQLVPCNYETAVKATRAPDSRVWLDINGADAGELELVLDQLDVMRLPRRLCLEARGRPGFYPMKTVTFMVIPVQAQAEDPRNIDYVALLFRPDVLLTLRDAPVPRQERDNLIQESTAWLPDSSIAGLVSGLLIALSLASLRRAGEMRDTIMALEQRMDGDPGTVEAGDISGRQSDLLAVDAMVSGQLPILEALMATERASAPGDDNGAYLACALANLHAAERTLSWLEGRMEVIRSLADAHAQDKFNHRLGRLTILSSIFMPLTLLAGIWGMNFKDMPELDLPYAYPIALAVMVFLGAGLYIAFRRRGWFD